MRHSILKRTLIIVSITFLIGFSILFVFQLKEATNAIETQILNNSMDNLSMVESYVKEIMQRQVNFISQLTQNKALMQSINEESADELFELYPTSFTSINSFMVIKDEEIIIINDWLPISNRTIDTSVYYEMRQRGRLITTSPYYSTILASRAIAIISSVVDEEGQELLLVAEILPGSLFSFLIQKMAASETLVVLDSCGNSVYFDKNSDLVGNLMNVNGQLDINHSLKQELVQIKSSISEIRLDHKKMIVRRIKYSNQWNLYMITDYTYYYSALYNMIKSYMIIGFLLLAFIVPISFMVSLLITKPVKILNRQIQNMSPNFPVLKLDNCKIVEINNLADSFNHLLTDLQAAMEQKSQMQKRQFENEYKVLQSQIHPHFIFNTHICVHSLLEQNKIEDAQNMLHSFDTLLRAVTYDLGETIKLEEEMMIVREYIRLQQFRIGDVFDFTIDDFEQFKEVSVPKLLLQPVIENAIYHGFRKLSRRGEIRIKFEQIDRELHIFIEDNGTGIPADVLKKLWTGEEEKKADRQRQTMVSIGLRNVKERIQHFYGKEYDLYVNSREGLGTTIEIVVCIDNYSESLYPA